MPSITRNILVKTTKNTESFLVTKTLTAHPHSRGFPTENKTLIRYKSSTHKKTYDDATNTLEYSIRYGGSPAEYITSLVTHQNTFYTQSNSFFSSQGITGRISQNTKLYYFSTRPDYHSSSSSIHTSFHSTFEPYSAIHSTGSFINSNSHSIYSTSVSYNDKDFYTSRSTLNSHSNSMYYQKANNTIQASTTYYNEYSRPYNSSMFLNYNTHYFTSTYNYDWPYYSTTKYYSNYSPTTHYRPYYTRSNYYNNQFYSTSKYNDYRTSTSNYRPYYTRSNYYNYPFYSTSRYDDYRTSTSNYRPYYTRSNYYNYPFYSTSNYDNQWGSTRNYRPFYTRSNYDSYSIYSTSRYDNYRTSTSNHRPYYTRSNYYSYPFYSTSNYDDYWVSTSNYRPYYTRSNYYNYPFYSTSKYDNYSPSTSNYRPYYTRPNYSNYPLYGTSRYDNDWVSTTNYWPFYTTSSYYRNPFYTTSRYYDIHASTSFLGPYVTYNSKDNKYYKHYYLTSSNYYEFMWNYFTTGVFENLVTTTTEFYRDGHRHVGTYIYLPRLYRNEYARSQYFHDHIDRAHNYNTRTYNYDEYLKKFKYNGNRDSSSKKSYFTTSYYHTRGYKYPDLQPAKTDVTPQNTDIIQSSISDHESIVSHQMTPKLSSSTELPSPPFNSATGSFSTSYQLVAINTYGFYSTEVNTLKMSDYPIQKQSISTNSVHPTYSSSYSPVSTSTQTDFLVNMTSPEESFSAKDISNLNSEILKEVQSDNTTDGYLVHTKGCKIPDFDPYHHTITKFISVTPPVSIIMFYKSRL